MPAFARDGTRLDTMTSLPCMGRSPVAPRRNGEPKWHELWGAQRPPWVGARAGRSPAIARAGGAKRASTPAMLTRGGRGGNRGQTLPGNGNVFRETGGFPRVALTLLRKSLEIPQLEPDRCRSTPRRRRA